MQEKHQNFNRPGGLVFSISTPTLPTPRLQNVALPLRDGAKKLIRLLFRGTKFLVITSIGLECSSKQFADCSHAQIARELPCSLIVLSLFPITESAPSSDQFSSSHVLACGLFHLSCCLWRSPSFYNVGLRFLVASRKAFCAVVSLGVVHTSSCS